MALSDLTIVNENAYSAMTEVLEENVELWNAAVENTLVIRPNSFQGDFADIISFKRHGGLIKRRNPKGSGALAKKHLEDLTDTWVKIASGTYPIDLTQEQRTWLKRNPAELGAALGQQLAKDVMADKVAIAVGTCYAALSQVSAIIYDGTGESTATMNVRHLNKAAFKFGDAANDVRLWLMSSTPMSDMIDGHLANAEGLFSYGTLNVMRDPMGRLFVYTDTSVLSDTVDDVTTYHTLGLTEGAVVVGADEDYRNALNTATGDENLLDTYQAQWTNTLQVKGFAWDKTNGGSAPNNAALFTATNWDRYASSVKSLAGVICNTL